MKLEVFIARIDRLPPAAQILPRLFRILRDPDSDLDQISSLIKLDPALTAQVLRLSNSSYYGHASASYDLQEAIQRLGYREVCKLVTNLCCRKWLKAPLDAYGLGEDQLWENALLCAFGLETLAPRQGQDAVVAYTVGLLHNLGKWAIHQQCSAELREVFEVLSRNGGSLLEAERQVLGFDHSEVAGALLSQWGFHEDICLPIRYQYEPSQVPAKQSRLTDLVHVANWAIASLGYNHGYCGLAFTMDPEVLTRLQLNEQNLLKVLLQVQESIQQAMSLMGVMEQSTAAPVHHL